MRGSDRDAGWALVSTLWATALLAMLAISGRTLMLSSHRFEQQLTTRDQVDASLEAGIARAVVAIDDPIEARRWPVDGTPQDFVFDGVDLHVAVQDELGRIDLNAADGSLFRRLLVASGVKDQDAERLTDCILDWRSGDRDLKRLHGANDADYAAAGKPYRPRHGPFQTVEELQLVLGMTPELFVKLRPALTVYTQRAAIDPQFATPVVLQAYFGEGETVDEMLRQRAVHGAARESGAVALGGRTFDIIVTGSHLGHAFRREAVVMLTGDAAQPDLVLKWA